MRSAKRNHAVLFCRNAITITSNAREVFVQELGVLANYPQGCRQDVDMLVVVRRQVNEL